MQNIFTTANQRSQTDDETIHFRSNSRVDICIRVMLAVTVVVLLVGPSAVLFLLPPKVSTELLVDTCATDPTFCTVTKLGYIQHGTLKLIIVTLCVLLFSLLLNLARCRRFEVFGASAAYCACLLAFLSNSTK